MPANRKAEKKKAESTQIEKPPVYEPNVPEPTCRAELLKYWINLSLDERTANKVLWITEGGAKVTRMTEELCPYLDNPDRFEFSPQVLCKETVWEARGYWEVAFSGWVVIGVTFEGMGRRASAGICGLGDNEVSWGLGWSGYCYQAWHKGVSVEVMNIPRCSTIGVYLDQPAGTLTFYTVECVKEGEEGAERKEVKLIYRFNKPMEEKMMPGFWLEKQSYCQILKKDE